MDGKSLPEWLLFTFSSVMHTFIGCLGLVSIMHASQVAAMLQAKGDFQGIMHNFWDAVALLVGNLALPFSEGVAVLATKRQAMELDVDSIGLEVFNVWLPAMLGLALLLTASLAHLSLRFRHTTYVAPYTILAVIFLVWQVELSKILSKISHQEELDLKSGQTRLEDKQFLQFYMFNVSYDGFSKAYDSQRCSATMPPADSGLSMVHVECRKESFEANLLKTATTQLCRNFEPSMGSAVDFQRRVDSCLNIGRRLRILPQRVQALPREQVFCRCRSAIYDWLRTVSRWIYVVWFSELVACCIVLYFGVEANLKQMDAQARNEILLFLSLGICALAMRVVVLEDADETGPSSLL